MTILLFDLEADGLVDQATTIWCLVTKELTTGVVNKYGPTKIKQGLLALYNADRIISHNYIGYDERIIKKFYPKWKARSYDDSLILSQLLYPERAAHSIESYGKDFDIEKPSHEDWSSFSEDMLFRCTQDVEILYKVYKKELIDLKSWDWQRAINLEYGVAQFHNNKQIVAGVDIDKKKLHYLCKRLDAEILSISTELLSYLPKRYANPYSVEIKKPFLKNGDYSKAVKDWMGEECATVKGPFTRIKLEEFNLNSHKQIKDYLLSQGWKPTQYNIKKDNNGNIKRTSPKLTEDSFDTIKGDIGQMLLKRAVLIHRRNYLDNIKEPGTKGLLSCIREDGRVLADAITCGTPTHRYRHKQPVVNIPKASPNVLYGKEIRELFCAHEPYRILGADMAGIELRLAAHYAYAYDKGVMRDQILIGDFHQDVATNVYKCDRDTGKSCTYGIIYGCGKKRLAEMLNTSTNKAAKILENFFKVNSGLGGLKRDLERAYKRNGGWIRGIDNRKIYIRSPHKLLNSLLQSSAAILFKTWLVNSNIRFEQEDLDAVTIIAMHDEEQNRVYRDDVELAREVLIEEAKRLQEIYNLNISIDIKCKVGMNWAETH